MNQKVEKSRLLDFWEDFHLSFESPFNVLPQTKDCLFDFPELTVVFDFVIVSYSPCMMFR